MNKNRELYADWNSFGESTIGQNEFIPPYSYNYNDSCTLSHGTDSKDDFDGDVFGWIPIQNKASSYMRNIVKTVYKEPGAPRTCLKELSLDLINHINYLDKEHDASGYVHHTLYTTSSGMNVVIIYGDNDDVIGFTHRTSFGNIEYCILVNYKYALEEMPYLEFTKTTMKIFHHLITFENGYIGIECECRPYIPFILLYDLMLYNYSNISIDMDKKFKEVGLYDELCKLDKGKDLYDVLLTFNSVHEAIYELIELSGIYRIL